ncbi:uncharacterized protein ATC70_001298 [Mucor velutinosus]|uniref:Uncharacterized protein n=1 Tax=Mucor velutinosus TaxID=708070 RepID=A0AAN7DJQ3_9FUNG|nr:hypothetical protein ATC70_001298 [Mucor velutinosus]
MSIVSSPLLRSTSFDILSSKRIVEPRTSTSLRRSSSASSSSSSSSTSANSVDKKYSYRTCPMCSERLLVRIHGAFVHKWINLHFANRHHEWMHVVVNLH